MANFVNQTFQTATELEIEWANHIIGDKITGINIDDVHNYIKFYANVRSKQLGYEKPYPEIKKNPLRWIKAYEDIDSGKSDFFEQKSRQYTKVNHEDNGFDDL